NAYQLHSFPTRRSSDLTVKADKDGFKKVEIDLSPAQVKALQAGTNSFSVALFDNAANAGTTSGEGNKPGETSFGLVLRNGGLPEDRKSTRLNSSHVSIS